MLLERRVEGMVFISAEITDVRGEHSHYAQLVQRGARLVFVNGGSEEVEVTSVGVDERAAGRMATEHLAGLGHQRIGFVAGDEFALPTREKSRGRLDALAAAGLDWRDLVAHTEFTVSGGRTALRQLMDRPDDERPTGVICSNDLMAIGAVQEAAALGLDVRRALDRRLRRHRSPLVGAAVDDRRAADRRDRADRDRRAPRADRAAGPDAAELRVPARLRLGRTTAPPASSDSASA